MNNQRILADDLLAHLPPPSPDPLPALQDAVRARAEKVVVLDDDPTGTQTVHGVPVLTEWSVEALAAELLGDAPAIFVLTNSRSLPLERAQHINREIGHALAEAGRRTGRRFVVASRSDSTLRGHFPGEVEALAEGLGTQFDAWLLAPFFAEGRRLTVDDVHYVGEGPWLVPAAQTESARDATFGYSSSNLRAWVAEKSNGSIDATSVASVSLQTIRTGGASVVAEQLGTLHSRTICVLNAATHDDLAIAIAGVIEAEATGKRFLYRTAASFVQLRAGIAPRPLLTAHDLSLPPGGGLIIAGSYVPRSTAQIEQLVAVPGIVTVEVGVQALLDDQQRTAEIERVTGLIDATLNEHHDVAVYTSRHLVTGDDANANLAIGRTVSDGLVAIVRGLHTRPRFFVAKGGITSSDIATLGLGVRRAMVLGQFLPGVPVWRLGPESRWPDLVYVVFPGNVGEANAIAQVVEGLRGSG